jgi:hypothetical protein
LVESEPITIPEKDKKSRTTAILIAVLLHFWTWAYTYHRDAWKFWVGLGVWLFMIMALTARIGPFGWLIALAVWIWSIVDAAQKPEDWYKQYE